LASVVAFFIAEVTAGPFAENVLRAREALNGMGINKSLGQALGH
jgi:hypothetical protein